MNVQRGLFRLWLVLSLLWVIFAGLSLFSVPKDLSQLYDSVVQAEHAPSGTKKIEIDKLRSEGKSDQEIVSSLIKSEEWSTSEVESFELYLADQENRARAVRNLRDFAKVGFGLPLAALVIGAALLWAFRGFRS